jgi:hypothetical protein
MKAAPEPCRVGKGGNGAGWTGKTGGVLMGFWTRRARFFASSCMSFNGDMANQIAPTPPDGLGAKLWNVSSRVSLVRTIDEQMSALSAWRIGNCYKGTLIR